MPSTVPTHKNFNKYYSPPPCSVLLHFHSSPVSSLTSSALPSPLYTVRGTPLGKGESIQWLDKGLTHWPPLQWMRLGTSPEAPTTPPALAFFASACAPKPTLGRTPSSSSTVGFGAPPTSGYKGLPPSRERDIHCLLGLGGHSYSKLERAGLEQRSAENLGKKWWLLSVQIHKRQEC